MSVNTGHASYPDAEYSDEDMKSSKRPSGDTQIGHQVTEQLETEPGSFLARYWQRLVALLLWGGLFLAYQWYTSANDLGPLAALRQLIEFMQSSLFGPLIYIGIYALRPLLFFPATLITLAGGYIFGPFWGVVYTVLGSNASAMVAYWVGRFFGQGVLDQEESEGVIQRYARRMRNNSFETVLIMRFVFLPYDLVNYLAGFLRIDWKAFLLATVLGSVPGTISFVLAGASIEGDLTSGIPSLDPKVLLMSAAIFVVSLALSRYFKSREENISAHANAQHENH